MNNMLKYSVIPSICLCFAGFASRTSSEWINQEIYVCTPCGSDCDNEQSKQAGNCAHCNMPLVKKSTINFKTLSPEDICSYLQQHPQAVVIDVRTKDEFHGKTDPVYGRIKNAINIPVQVLESKLSSIESMKNKEVIVYCSHSKRSPRASYLLTQNGFTNVTNMSGGISVMKDNACKK
jgi:rhodanese-related sulfurtransferase